MHGEAKDGYHTPDGYLQTTILLITTLNTLNEHIH